MAGTITATKFSSKGRGKKVTRVNLALLVTSSTTIAAAPIGSYFGKLVAVLIDPVAGAGTTMDTAADILLTDALTGAPILSDLSVGTGASAYRPTQVITDNAGVAVSAAASAVDVNRDIYVAGNLNLAIANAVNGDSALISFVFEEV